MYSQKVDLYEEDYESEMESDTESWENSNKQLKRLHKSFTTGLQLTSFEKTWKDMIDKDGYLQGMQGIKMTNKAIHDRMKTLKDSVVKSEDSVKRLVAEIKMLGQRVFNLIKPYRRRKSQVHFQVSSIWVWYVRVQDGYDARIV
ncbi:hypothetical protein BSL78_00100 [Apostichopus japonicus]|uniref:Uncharacterized protein n=1 Tax=Stichopus japonicus TaxID=307972 RepID=A0A2G8LRT9_STIJA|nr:hypothetical protein BSL78_00100 [Apostichopus japonicus]